MQNAPLLRWRSEAETRVMVRWLVVAAALTLTACADAEKERLLQTTRPTYDPKTGRLTALTYDANRNGKIDTWTDMDGTRPLRARLDRDEDGIVDRWEYYDAAGALVKVGFSQQNDGTADAWAFSGPDGRIQRIEVSTARDEQRIDRVEYYDPARAAAGNDNALVRTEIDTDQNGRIDRWETYEDGALRTAAYDENGDGRPDRRLTYLKTALTLIESNPDSSGRFMSRVDVKQ
jgi:hypothetical protein